MTQELSKALSIIRQAIHLPLGRNCHYKEWQFFELLAKMSCLNAFAEGVSNAFRGTLPQADGLFYHVSKLGVTQVQESFDRLMKRNLVLAKRQGLLRKPVYVAVDFTQDPFYGKPTSFSRGGKEKAGTHWGVHYLTASVVENGQRFVIAALPFGPLDAPGDVVERLLFTCKTLVRIECVLMDRGFFTEPVVSLLQRQRFDYVMPAVRNKKIAALERGVTDFPTTVHTELNGVPIKLFFVKEGDDVLVYCTSLQCWRNKIVDYYAQRWGIETSYRVTDGLQAKTCSRVHGIRVFLAYFAIALYNALQLAKAMTPTAWAPSALSLRLLVINWSGVETGGSAPP